MLFTEATDTSSVTDGILRIPVRRNNLQKQAIMDKRDGSTAPLYNFKGKTYTIEIGVGTPSQLFNVSLDTGSADLWIPTTNCPVTSCPLARFDQTKSSSFKSTGQAFSNTYGIGEVNGTYGFDVVTVGGTSLPNQSVGFASETREIIDTQTDGLLGMAWPGMNTIRNRKDSVPFPFNLMQQNKLAQPIFSVYFNSQFAMGNVGELILGGIDQTKFSGTLAYVPVATYSPTLTGNLFPNLGQFSGDQGTYIYWTVPGQAITVPSSSGQPTFSTNFDKLRPFIFDTGTTITYVSDDIIPGILKALTQNSSDYRYNFLDQTYRINCALAKQSNVVEFDLSTSLSNATSNPVKVSVPIADLIIPIDSNSPDTARACAFGLAPQPLGTSLSMGNAYILGDSVLRSVYQVYDMKNSRIGVAPAKNNPFSWNDTAAASSTSRPGSGRFPTNDPFPFPTGLGPRSAASKTSISSFVTMGTATLILYILA
ncbi:hypothetical protein EC973_003884 [Apophysomyces ossiformis]|uniref:rhizopuspepsin n=1 Tax=Apophysomyces ossiformis TaxID=679940 RepID=A0A8H7BGN6_9FUNG|nr:hypothetical protein EC973_003884 [Apophysomyces ossiformis]